MVDIGDGLVAVFKMESHNHPSFIEPYQGAATGVGGILRDVFTMGARPVALLDALRFGDPAHPKTRHLIGGVVAGIGGYGNCVGVPTVGGECTFHRAYNGNILVNAMCVGVARADRVFYAKASGVGNPVVYVGAKTGRDGIHGATMASAEFSDETEAKRPTVQVGDPFTEKLLIEACLELMEIDCIVAIQDMGAAGLTSSSFEMAARGEAGIELDLDRVPLRETGMTPYEIMLSESQERMLMVLEDGRESRGARGVREVGPRLRRGRPGHRHRPHGAALAGRGRRRRAGGRRSAAPRRSTTGPTADAPSRCRLPASDREALDAASRRAAASSWARPTSPASAGSGSSTTTWSWADTVQRPGGDAAVVRVHGTGAALALTTDCTPRYCYADPRRGGMQAVAESLAQSRRRSAPGRWRSPTASISATPSGRRSWASSSAASRAWPRPAGRSTSRSCRATCRSTTRPTATRSCRRPNVGGVGLIDDLRAHGRHRLGASRAWRWCCSASACGWLGCSLYLREIAGPRGRRRRRRSTWRPSGATASSCWARSRPAGSRACHDLADGGLAVALAEMCLASGIGAATRRCRRRRASVAAAGCSARTRAATCWPCARRELPRAAWIAAAAAGVIARAVGRTGGDALTPRRRSAPYRWRSCARRTRAGCRLHGGRRRA